MTTVAPPGPPPTPAAPEPDLRPPLPASGPPIRARPSRGGRIDALDGLRTLCVVAVVAYHLDLGWATGGFLGVEVFFVLSGYLITGLLLREAGRRGRISVPDFWRRRARRLLPAVVVLVAAVMTWSLFAVPNEVAGMRGSALASLLYVENWYAIVTDVPYFATFGRPSPFQHLWSLAIEEQMYLLWPIVLAVALRTLGARRAALLTAALAVGSVALMAAFAEVAAPERAYYGTDTRAFGLLAGALLAYGLRPSGLRAGITRVARLVLDAVGVAALVLLCVQLGRRSEFEAATFPWGFVTVDALSIVLIVVCVHPATRVGRLLGVGLLAAIGRRSYSIYLWHWPVLVFTRPGVDWGLTGTVALAARLALIGVLAELSYRLVEQPWQLGRAQIRLGRWWAGLRRGRAIIPATGTVVAAVAVAVAVITSPSTTPTVGARTTAELLVAPPSPPVADPVDDRLFPRRPTAATTTTTSPPTTTTAPPPRHTVEPVSVFGESVTLGAGTALYGRLVPGSFVDAVEGRSWDAGVEQVEAHALTDTLADVVVAHLGSNGYIPEGGLDRLLRAVGPDRLLVLVTVRVPTRWQDPVNEQLRGFAERHDNVRLADWRTLSDGPGLRTADGVHLTPAGAAAYTDLILRTIDGAG